MAVVPVINCPECAGNIVLSTSNYWDVKDAPIKCGNCGTSLVISLDKGNITNLRPTTSKG
jgi:transcription elongation factor Elf1